MPRRMLTCCEREEIGRSRKVVCACEVQRPIGSAARLLRRHRPSPPSPRRGDGGCRRRYRATLLLLHVRHAELAFADRPAAALGAATGVGRRAGDLRAIILDLRVALVDVGLLQLLSRLQFAAAAAPTAASRKKNQMCGMAAARGSAASGVRWARATARAATRSRACENYMIGRHGRRRECEAWGGIGTYLLISLRKFLSDSSLTVRLGHS